MKIIKINAVWCPGCLITNKIFKDIEKRYPDINITSYDYDFDEEIVSNYNIGKKLPVIIFTDNNDIELERLIGEKTIIEIEGCINKYEEK